MKSTKKILSIVLSILMIMTSVTCAFTVFGEEGDAFDVLAQALKNDTVKNLSSYADIKSDREATYTFPNYADYAVMADVLAKLETAVKATDTYNTHEQDTSRSPQEIMEQLAARMKQGSMTDDEYSNYNIATFFNVVFNQNGLYVDHGTVADNQNNISSKSNVITVQTTDYKGYLATVGTYDKVDQNIVMGKKLTLTCYSSMKIGCTTFYDNCPSAIATATASTDNTVRPVITAHKTYLDEKASKGYTFASLVAMDTVELIALRDDVKAELDRMYAYVGSESTYKKLFGETLTTLLQNCNSAIDFAALSGIADQMNDFVAANDVYGTFCYPELDDRHESGQLEADWAAYKALYDQVVAGGKDVLDYLTETGAFDQTYYNNFNDNVVVYVLKQTKADADALYNEYKDIHETLPTAEQTAVYSLLTGYLYATMGYSEQVISAIFPTRDKENGISGYEYLTELAQALYAEINEYVVYFVQKLNTSFDGYSTQAIMDTIAEIPEKLAGLNDFYNELATDPQIGAERAEELIGALKANAENLVEGTLYPFLGTRFAAQVNAAHALWTSYGKPTVVNDYDTYFTLRTTFNALEDEILAYFDNAPDAEDPGVQRPEFIDQATRDLYAELEIAFQAYRDFRDSFGFSAYEQTKLDYEVREVYSNDVVKTEDYVVTEELLNSTIAKLDEFITSETFADLVGIEGGLGDMLKDLLGGLIYSDSLINLIAGNIYPLIAEYIDQGLIDLMGESTWNGIKGLLTEDSIGTLVERETIVRFTPEKLSEVLPTFGDSKYQTIKDALKGAGSDWESWRIYDASKGSLTFDWGIDEIEDPQQKEERFFQAAGVALVGLSPLLAVLLCDTPLTVEIPNAASLIISISMTLGFGSNPGYVNALGPIFDLLGVTTADGLKTNTEMKAYGANAANMTNNDNAAQTRATAISNILKAVFNPLFNGIDKIMENPVDNVLGLLPNLVYALAFNMVPAILKQLKAPIKTLKAGSILDLSGVLGDGAELNIGDLVDLEDMGLDLSNGLNGILAMLGVDLPAFDEAKLATLGELVVKDGSQRLDRIYSADNLTAGQYYQIEADKAGVAYYILSYAVGLIKDGKLGDLLGAFLDEDKIATANKVLDMLAINDTGDAVAAIVELLNMAKYPEAAFSYDNFADVASTATTTDVKYTNYWTRMHAQYIYDNIDVLAANLLELVGIITNEDGTSVNISATLKGLINDNLFTNDMIATLTGLVSGLLEGLDDSILDIINTIDPLVNLDVADILAAVQDPQLPAFTDGDKDGFVNALAAYIEPLVPVLRVLLVGENIKLIDGIVTVYGGNGYENGLVPILEAIGCDVNDIASPAAFANMSDKEMVKAILNPILALVDKLIGDNVSAKELINNVLGIIPNILYFVENDGLNQAVENLLQPIYAVLDVIRPIFNVDLPLNFNLAEMLSDLLADTTISLGDSITIVLPSYTELTAILYSIGTVTTYTSATGDQAKRLDVEAALSPDFLTTILRMVVDTLFFANNQNAVEAWINGSERLSDSQKEYLINLVDALNKLSTDEILLVFFFMFFGINTGVQGAVDLRDLVSDEFVAALQAAGYSDVGDFQDFVTRMGELLKAIFNGGELDPSGTANGATSFIQKIIDFFNNIFAQLRRLFGLN